MKLLAKIQQELKSPKGQHNKFGNFNYRSCEDILEAVKPFLSGATLTLSDEVKSVGDVLYIEATARLNHNSEIAEAKASAGINLVRKGMDVAQSFGASSSYARKYALGGLFLLDDTKDADTKDNSGEVNIDPPSDKRVEEIKKQIDSLFADKGKTATITYFKSLDALERKSVRGYTHDKVTSK